MKTLLPRLKVHLASRYTPRKREGRRECIGRARGDRQTARGDTISLPHGLGSVLGIELAVSSTLPSALHDQEGQKKEKLGAVTYWGRKAGRNKAASTIQRREKLAKLERTR